MTYSGEAVTIHHISPAGKDKYGDAVVSTETTETMTMRVAPTQSTEDTDRARDGVVDAFTLYAPAGTTLTFTDTLTVRGVLCRVDGDPETWSAGVVIHCVRA